MAPGFRYRRDDQLLALPALPTCTSSMRPLPTEVRSAGVRSQIGFTVLDFPTALRAKTPTTTFIKGLALDGQVPRHQPLDQSGLRAPRPLLRLGPSC